jgi:hypothetical protein
MDSSRINSFESVFLDTGPEPLPVEIFEFLKRLSILNSVPFNYLVPMRDALPNESLRFFHMDMNWIFAMLDGALSVGRDTALDAASDIKIINDVIDKVFSENHNIRRALQGKAPLFHESLKISDGIACAGFILNSVMVQGWRGLEFRGFGKDGERLECLRMETLSSTILFGLFRGKLQRLEIVQPPESFHFGFSTNSSGAYFEKKLRDEESGSLTDKVSVVKIRGNQNRRVINMSETAQEMRNALAADDITPARFALHMMQNAYTGVVDISYE